MDEEPLVWERVEWRLGDGRYVYEVAEGGLFATVTAPGERSLTLPVVAWDAMLDAVAAARKARRRGEREQPSRAGQMWVPSEVDRLIAEFEGGASIARLARSHNRTGGAIETKLARLGLWDREARRPTTGRDAADTALVPKDWPPPWPPMASQPTQLAPRDEGFAAEHGVDK